MKIKSMRGRDLDMNLLKSQNATKPAIGNAHMNARGDVIGKNGIVVKTREQITREYNTSNPKAVKQVSLKNLSDEIFTTPAEAVAEIKAKQAAAPQSQPPEAPPVPQRKRKIEDRED